MACFKTTTSGTQPKKINNTSFMLKDNKLGRVVSDEHNRVDSRVLEKRVTYKPTEDHHDYLVLPKHEKLTTYDSENYAVVEKRNAHKQPSSNTVPVEVNENNHDYYVLKKHEQTTTVSNDIKSIRNGFETLATLQNLAVDKVSGTQQENHYDISDHTRDNSDKRTANTGSTHVYNTFNDFKDDDYDHLEDHDKIPRALESDYNTTDECVNPACENTYDHINQKPKVSKSTDNVYGMPRVDNDYDRVSSVNASFV